MTSPVELEPVRAPSGPALAERVAARVGKAEPDTEVAEVTAAVNRFVRRWHAVPPEGTAWPEDTVTGAHLLAVRLYRRRNSPSGVETFGAEGAAYVSRNDPDVAMLLQLGAYAPPWVG